MPFNNWNIPTRLFDIRPITRTTLQSFTGRDRLVPKIRRQISGQNIRVIFEGEVGTGKINKKRLFVSRSVKI